MNNIKDQENINQKIILLRLDLNVPLKNGVITDQTRIDKILPVINFLIKKNCKIVIISHVGRPKGKVNKELSLKPICENLESKINQTDVGVIIVDYLNQVKRSNAPSKGGQYDWTEQIEVSKTLKSMAQEYEVPVFSPYQTDNTGEARFAKGILDAADAAYTIETWSPEDECITFNCTKMRSAKMEGFTSVMDWETLKIGPQSTMNPKDRETLKDSMATGEEINDAI